MAGVSFFFNVLCFIKSSGHDPKDALHIISRIRLLAAIGYAPRLSGCGKCGSKSLDFYPDSGTTLCRKCAANPGDGTGKAYMKINNKVIHFYTHSIEWPINISNRLRPNEQTLSEINGLLDRHLGYLLSKKLRSSEFPARPNIA